MITFIPRDKVSKNWTIIGPILSIFLTVFFGLLIFTFLGYNPLETLYQIFLSPFSVINSPVAANKRGIEVAIIVNINASI